MAAHTETGPPGLDLDRLREYLAGHGLAGGPLVGEVIHGGKSNLTYVVRDGDHRFVVRRPPLGHVLATAHDMAREYRVMTALRDTGVPVPRTYHLCDDPGVLGAPFYVMEFVEGGQPPATPEIEAELVDILARLHALDPAKIGLGDFGRPEGFLERQVRRWKRQLDASRSREVPGIDELFTRLDDAVPVTQRHTIVHGDFKLGNTLIAHGRVRAVVDWEMSTLGDPLTDLALFLLYGDFAALDTGGTTPAGPEHGTTAAAGAHGAAPAGGTPGTLPAGGAHGTAPVGGAHGTAPVGGGHGTAPAGPAREVAPAGLVGEPAVGGGVGEAAITGPARERGGELAARYAAAAGLDISRLGWYVALACFKLAVIAEGIHFRYTQGLTVGEGFAQIGESVAPLAAHGLNALEE
ncbi:phosphotransferase family protein [Sphaerisporangium sp. TRM90804]|uniref:phosphotransferase family protein n=1 Tax=Sphaerisporangium sp. TRM90804 TaxID=3031113 RepID=UPI002449A813|nr:phosphotransferase family protein [Sphaerisporangium sp. TRM90804]MDH2427444.1 phosphotransferase family protein [Sphaerisporangium sp. TRM90804]